MPLSRREFCLHAAAASSLLTMLKSQARAQALENTGLKDLYKSDFRIGTAISNQTLQQKDAVMLGLIAKEFNAITPENCLKWGQVHPDADRWEWELPDRFVQFGLDHKMFILGHTLVWHSQVARNLFMDAGGGAVSREVLLKRMEDHIRTLVGRYKGKVTAWDVVNEAVDEDKGWRKSPWLNSIGPEYLEKAFHLAHEVDGKAQLLYNDYNMHNPKKAEFVAEFVRDFKKRGVPIHGVGMQGHEGLDYSSIEELEASILLFAKAGVRVHITELDVDVLPRREQNNTAEVSARYEYADALNPWPKGLPEEMEKRLAKRYEDLFRLFLKHRDKIDRITTWGTSDDESWKNNFPVPGRTNYPLLFDRQKQRKAAYYAVAALKKQ
jgi:endo-1,4-beta-xylanase